MKYRLTVEFDVPESEGDPRTVKAVDKVVDYAMRKLGKYDVDISGAVVPRLEIGNPLMTANLSGQIVSMASVLYRRS